MAVRILLDGLTVNAKVYKAGDVLDNPPDWLLAYADGRKSHGLGRVAEVVTPIPEPEAPVEEPEPTPEPAPAPKPHRSHKHKPHA